MRSFTPVLLAFACYRGSPEAEPPAVLPLEPGGQPIEQAPGGESGCREVVRLRAPDPAAVRATLSRYQLAIVELRAVVIPPQGTPSDVVRTVTVAGTPLTGIIEQYTGTCVRSWRTFAVDRAGDVWKLESPSFVVDYAGGRCQTERGWVPCNLAGATWVLYVLPEGKAFVGVVNPETGLRIDLPPGR